MSVAKDKSTGLWYYVFKVKNPITNKVSWKKKRGFAPRRYKRCRMYRKFC